ncbi:hypothetical protein SAMN02745146_3373 [Hymenobacter daecheongensis DSM 21074]|uniref:SpoIIAA-like n=1 Tax=Hymenobacter daecheongensis DSM 21074 TaxID=1121955 RepID=A0A1M6K3A8_9BACT|nr:hypothetical protein [Hymenobacter daecheongensis]SHJ53332.1 hypothetical protein SAMN02745146_3373 [Hymenobacter daecheongensis DSM 21074]
MRISKHVDQRDGSSCELILDETNKWLHAIWLGYIDPQEAYNGASRFLTAMQELHCPYLLNDNSQLQGPWFDSVEWLRTVWGPQAQQLGLRCIAHVVQPQDLSDEATLAPLSFGPELQLQLFDDVVSAQDWLRAQQAAQAPVAAAQPGSATAN